MVGADTFCLAKTKNSRVSRFCEECNDEAIYFLNAHMKDCFGGHFLSEPIPFVSQRRKVIWIAASKLRFSSQKRNNYINFWIASSVVALPPRNDVNI